MALSKPTINAEPDASSPQTLGVRQNFSALKNTVDALVDAVNVGVQGPQGAGGAQGTQGPQGTQGTAGGQGPQGAAGAQGTPGTPGSGGAATAIIGDPATTPTAGHPDGTLLIDGTSGSLMFKLGTQWIPASL